MAFSVNTNVGAMAALQSLNATNRGLETTQSRINTGMKVSSTKDDSAAYTIAQKLRGDVGGLNAVNSSLSRAKSTVDVAVAGVEQISDLLNQMKAKTIEASDAGLDDGSRSAIKGDLDALKGQVETIISSSSFNGTNLLDGSATGTVSALQSLASTSTTGSLTVANQGLAAAAVTNLGAAGAGVTLASAANADTLRTSVEAMITTVKGSLTTLGSASRKIEAQMSFTSKLTDVIQSGIGNLVDADLAKESANLQALQVKQQLGLQALSIANQAPQSIMSLFR